MILFDYQEIILHAYAKPIVDEFSDSHNQVRTRFGREMLFVARFDTFIVDTDNLYDLAFIKSMLQHFMQFVRNKRISKETISRVLSHSQPLYNSSQQLSFDERQLDLPPDDNYNSRNLWVL
jgi:CRISPR/Cas system CMR-associated protein Cmr5 small subunit